MTIGTQLILTGVDRAAMLAVFARGDHQQRHVVEGEPQRAATRQAHRVLERQALPAVGTGEITHAALPFRTAPRPPRRRSRFAPIGADDATRQRDVTWSRKHSSAAGRPGRPTSRQCRPVRVRPVAGHVPRLAGADAWYCAAATAVTPPERCLPGRAAGG